MLSLMNKGKEKNEGVLVGEVCGRSFEVRADSKILVLIPQ